MFDLMAKEIKQWILKQTVSFIKCSLDKFLKKICLLSETRKWGKIHFV